MAVDHYENFPVASVLLPPRLAASGRPDLPLRARSRRLRRRRRCAARGRASQQLDAFAQQLRSDRARSSARDRRGSRSSATSIRAPRSAARSLFHDLLSAFSQDVTQDALRDLRRGARLLPPLGRIRSGGCCSSLYGAPSRDTLRVVRRDLLEPAAHQFLAGRRDRLPQGPHLPAAGRAGALRRDARKQIARGDARRRWRAFMAFQIERARALLHVRRAARPRAHRAASGSSCA